MLLVTTKMNANRQKQKELTQTLRALAGQVRKEAGCVNSWLYRDLESENALCVFEEWETQADLDAHLQSENFRVFCGAVKLLNGSSEMEMMTYSDSHTLGAEVVRRPVSATPAVGKKNRKCDLCCAFLQVGARTGPALGMIVMELELA